jgi:hypothetical protein
MMLKFRPNRPIFVNENNLGVKTKIEALHAIEKLRSEGWLCTYNENIRPFHLSFDDESELAKFKATASKLKIQLVSQLIKPDSIDDFSSLDKPALIAPEAKSTHEDVNGRLKIDVP